MVLCDLTCEPFIYTVKKDNLVSCITKEDGAYAVCKILDNLDKVNKKEINLGNIECKYEDILNNILKCHGLSFNYILSRIFLSWFSPQSPCIFEFPFNALTKSSAFLESEELSNLKSESSFFKNPLSSVFILFVC